MDKQTFIEELNDFIKVDALHDNKDGHYPDYNREVAINLASSGDYDNSCAVERANYRDLKEMENPLLSFGHGDFGWKYVYFNMTEIEKLEWSEELAEKADEIIEIINGLSDYPCINEETVSEIEMELQDEAWENWGESDFISALDKAHDIEAGYMDYDSEALKKLFNEKSEEIGEYWIIESGGTAYIDLEKIAQNIELKELSKIFYHDFEEKQDPECFPTWAGLSACRKMLEKLEEVNKELQSEKVAEVIATLNKDLKEKEEKAIA